MREIRTFIFLHLFYTAFLLTALPLSAQQDGAAFSVQIADNQHTFHIGERIPLDLTFSSPNDTDYQIALVISGRGGEVDCNKFEVESPTTGWSDPLEMYFKQDLTWFGHGWGPRPLKKSEPVKASFNLNQWIRFDQPGDYAVKATSHCISKTGDREPYLLSNTISLRIVAATPEWQDEKLKSIKAEMDLLDREAQSGNLTQSQWNRHSELAGNVNGDLMYLATPASVVELVSRSGGTSRGLGGLPPALRETAIAAMNKKIEEPGFPISRDFISTLAFLHVTPGSDKESVRSQIKAIDPVIWSTVLSAATKKTPSARAQTIETLLQDGENISTPEVKHQMASLLKLSFGDNG